MIHRAMTDSSSIWWRFLDGYMDEAFLRLHAEIHARLNAGTPKDVQEARRLCATLPQPTAETQSHIDHLRMSAGFALESLGEIDAALALYEDLMHCDDADREPRSNACFRYGLIRESQGRSAESVAAYELASASATLPSIARAARERLATLLLREGRLEEAERHLEVLAADPGLTESQLLAGRLQRLSALQGRPIRRPGAGLARAAVRSRPEFRSPHRATDRGGGRTGNRPTVRTRPRFLPPAPGNAGSVRSHADKLPLSVGHDA